LSLIAEKMGIDRFLNFSFAMSPLIPSLLMFYTLHDSLVNEFMLKAVMIGIIGYFTTSSLIPVVSEYTKKAGMSGKDLGKKGTVDENKDIPEALGLCSGTVFLMCTICSQLIFAKNCEQVSCIWFDPKL
jgi:hypothetical protein